MSAKNRRRGHCAAVDERGQLPVLFVRTTGEGIRGSEGIFELTARKQKLFPCSGEQTTRTGGTYAFSDRTGSKKPSEGKCGSQMHSAPQRFRSTQHRFIQYRFFEASASRSPPQTDPRPPHNAGRELRRFPNASRFIRRYDSTEFFTIRMISCKLYCLYFIFAGKDIRFL